MSNVQAEKVKQFSKRIIELSHGLTPAEMLGGLSIVLSSAIAALWQTNEDREKAIQTTIDNVRDGIKVMKEHDRTQTPMG